MGTVRTFRRLLIATVVWLVAVPHVTTSALEMQVAGSYPVGDDPSALAVGDLDRDGHPDVVVANLGSRNMSVLLGSATGELHSAATYATGPEPTSIALGDLDRDGVLDVVTSGSGNTRVYFRMGNGAGGFGSLKNIDAGSTAPVATAVADLNGDGKLDLITANAGSDSIGVFRGDGHGSFDAPRSAPYSAPIAPDALAVVDLNGDARPDVVASSTTDDSVAAFLGDGTGRLLFSARRDLAGRPAGMAAADVNRDGAPDVVVAVASVDSIVLLAGDGDGGFAGPGAALTLGSAPSALALGDANGDGSPDLFVDTGTGIMLELGDGTGSFTQATDAPWTVPGGRALVAKDVNGDGLDDAVLATDAGQVVVALNRSRKDASVEPSALDLGSQPLGGASPSQSVSVEGSGLPTTVTRVSVDHPEFEVIDDRCTGYTVGDARAACAVSVRFVPAATGPRSATLRIATDADAPDLSVVLTGSGVDADPPETTITSRPSAQTTDTSVSFTFESDEPGTFECSLDGADYAPCTSPASASGLDLGSHTFRVRAIDASGNIDPTPDESTFEVTSVDVVPPETTITEHPAALTNVSSPVFRFIADTQGATFVCSVDGADPFACGSPYTMSGLAEGPHRFAAAAVDDANNVDPTPDVFAFDVDLTPPNTTVSGPSHPSKRNARFTFRFTEDVSVVRCSVDGSGFSLCKTPYSARSLRTGRHVLRVQAIDEAGNEETTPAVKRFTIVSGR